MSKLSIFDDEYDFENPHKNIINTKKVKKTNKLSIWDDEHEIYKNQNVKANITDILRKLKYNQLQALARYHNLHYKIKLVGKQHLIDEISKLYEYKNGIYSLKEKPFEMVLKDDTVKQVVNIKKK